MYRRFTLAAATALALLPVSTFAQSNELVLYCSVGEEWCRAQSEAFSRETGINVLMTRKSSGETFAQIKAEEGQPRGDVWWGGTGDPHLQAAQEGLTEEYKSPMLAELQAWAVGQAETSGFRTVGIYAGALGFGYNSTLVTENPPACWKDLLDARYKEDIQVANPNSSGTSYTMLATMVQLMGEDEAFAYLKDLHANINQYTKSGSAPIRAAATGESAIGIVFMHDAVAQTVEGAPIVTVAPCEGTGYEVGSMSLIKGGPNPEAAKAWYEWALSAKAQEIGATAKSFQVPSNSNAATPPEAPKLADIKLIDYDFAKYGSSEVRTALLARWDAEIGALPK
ncbi:MAG: ABC transporter substrate-binding protein [Hoeflea sp.]|uniref:ABC transporter substrate-binding protein n=1 Tax=Hoeflea sp. TaxID=1940281 RepID=UPI001E0E0F55|nr:ABC transporter substrate-binding protein [Hoeflea sp.]MBU4531468.1 ABC transporter substrate-binding protein [Alphaproteobacteria bacterium]MBU4544325.1 ABC transporter substrate-binding protein [Alphaproteobacteria bacterium]MBU4550438.1 ABC transporter substrate-binding protein [Alphaproteobacteria bacterium]MBV1724744.1 ABC transporter substrate-binding protein [Hoeflea sp.]MBV1760764.1 ABC transporter substrate-binding protein [Hoeflea sp.]